jgi:hypothetical protein
VGIAEARTVRVKLSDKQRRLGFIDALDDWMLAGKG